MWSIRKDFIGCKRGWLWEKENKIFFVFYYIEYVYLIVYMYEYIFVYRGGKVFG